MQYRGRPYIFLELHGAPMISNSFEEYIIEILTLHIFISLQFSIILFKKRERDKKKNNQNIPVSVQLSDCFAAISLTQKNRPSKQQMRTFYKDRLLKSYFNSFL